MTPPDPPAEPGGDRGDRASRLSRLLELLAEHGRLSVSAAAQHLGVSEATVRRDFNSLAQQQLVTRTHGGVVAASVAYDLPVRYRTQENDARERIAGAAAHLARPGEVVGFNGGTTTSATARRVAARPELTESMTPTGLTVVTNALNIATELVLRPHVKTVTLGGIARPQSYEQVGPLASMVLSELWIDHLFLGVDGIDADEGASCLQEGEADINALMVRRASRVTVVAAARKLGRRTLARICGIEAIDTLVTDQEADPGHVDAIRAHGVDVVLA